MRFLKKCDDIMVVCDSLTLFIGELRQKSAAIRAYINTYGNVGSNNPYLRCADECIFRELLSELGRIFDKSSTFENENCSVHKLKELCLSEKYKHMFVEDHKDPLIILLDFTAYRYNNLSSINFRNKQLAHHDIKQIKEGNPVEIPFEKIEEIIIDLTKIFEQVITKINSYGLPIPVECSYSTKYEKLVSEYENSLKSLDKVGMQNE